jgi:hypothetical protein
MRRRRCRSGYMSSTVGSSQSIFPEPHSLKTEGSVKMKVDRGALPAWLTLATLRAVGTHALRLREPD